MWVKLKHENEGCLEERDNFWGWQNNLHPWSQSKSFGPHVILLWSGPLEDTNFTQIDSTIYDYLPAQWLVKWQSCYCQKILAVQTIFQRLASTSAQEFSWINNNSHEMNFVLSSALDLTEKNPEGWFLQLKTFHPLISFDAFLSSNATNCKWCTLCMQFIQGQIWKHIFPFWWVSYCTPIGLLWQISF